MKIQAYCCDCCNKLTYGEDMTGINPSRNLFEAYESYPIIPDPVKADIHVCTDCYYEKVLRPSGIEFKTGTPDYETKRREMWYILAETCIQKRTAKRDKFGRLKK